jgi:hypothetical protein
VLRAWAADHGALVLGEPGDVEAVEAAEAALAEAEEELRLFSTDLTARHLLGDAWGEALKVRADAVEAARLAYREAAQAVATGERVVSGLQRLDEPEAWPQLVRDVIDVVEVKRGRGPVEGRVRVLVRDSAAPELPELPEDAGTVVGELPELTDADAHEAAV